MKIKYFIFSIFLVAFFQFAVGQAEKKTSSNYIKYTHATSLEDKLRHLSSINKWDYYAHKDAIEQFLDSVQAKKIKNRLEFRYYNMAMGHIFYIQSNYNKAIEHLNFAVRDSLDFPTNKLLLVYKDLFESYDRTNNYGACIYYLEKLKQIKDTLQENSPEYKELNNYYLPEEKVYYKAGMYADAIHILKGKYLLELDKHDRNEFLLIGQANNLGIYYTNKHEYDSAVVFYRKSISHYSRLQDTDKRKSTYLLAMLKGNLGEAYLHLGVMETAERFLIEDADVNKTVSPESACWSAILAAECLLKRNNTVEAKKYLDFFEELKLGSTSITKLKIKYLRTLSAYYSQIKQFEKSTYYLEKSVQLSDSMEIVNAENMYLKSKLAFVISSKNKEIASKKHQVDELVKNDDATKQQLLKIRIQYYKILLLGVLLLLVLVYTIVQFIKRRKTNKRLKKLNKQIANTNAIIESKIHKKEIDSEEINRNREELTAIVFKVFNQMGEKNGTTNLEELEVRLKALHNSHKLLNHANDLNNIYMNNYLNALATMLSRDNVKVTVAFDKLKLNYKQATCIAMLIYELYRNSIKNVDSSFKLNIVLSLVELKDSKQFVYKDNVVINTSDETMLGAENLLIIEKLTELLHGYYKMRSKTGVYFEFILT